MSSDGTSPPTSERPRMLSVNAAEWDEGLVPGAGIYIEENDQAGYSMLMPYRDTTLYKHRLLGLCCWRSPC